MKMSPVGRIFESVILVIVALALAACASVPQKPIVLEPGEKSLVMKVDNFKFEPNDIKAHRGDILMVKLENMASVEHNFTVKTPQGATLVSVNIPSKGTVDVKINPTETGTYPFYCNKSFHSTMGMKGQIEVTAP